MEIIKICGFKSWTGCVQGGRRVPVKVNPANWQTRHSPCSASGKGGRGKKELVFDRECRPAMASCYSPLDVGTYGEPQLLVQKGHQLKHPGGRGN